MRPGTVRYLLRRKWHELPTTSPLGRYTAEVWDSRRSAIGVVDRRTSAWVDLVHDLVTHPTSRFPRALLQRQLFETFDCWVCSSWLDAELGARLESSMGIPGWPDADTLEDMRSAIGHNPWVRWYSSTSDPRPMTTGRVPRAFLTPKGHAIARDYLRPAGVDEQLYIPYSVGSGRLGLFTIGRTGSDFSVEDLETARQIQPLLRVVDRHFRVLGGAPESSHQLGLTGREVAVVRLLANGLTAPAIAGRLAISPRTVHRHLENAYRKLGVSDRISAVLAAEQAGLLTTMRAGDCGHSVPPTAEVGPAPVFVRPDAMPAV